MRRPLAVWLLLLIVALPAIDFVYCPDGCTANRSPSAGQSDVSASPDGCERCLNGLAVYGSPAFIEPIERLMPLDLPLTGDLVSNPLRSIDRPPRLA